MGVIADYLNEWQKENCEHLKELLNDPILKAINELRDKRIIAQQLNRLKEDKRRMNSFGRWSKMMRDKYEGDKRNASLYR